MFIKSSGKLKKILVAVCILLFASTNAASTVLAISSNGSEANLNKGVQNLTTNNTNSEKTQKELITKKILGKREDASKEFLYIKNLNDINLVNVINGQTQSNVLKGDKASAGTARYTLAELKAMDYAPMMDAIAGTSWGNISDLFRTTEESKAFYNDTPRFKYIMEDFAARGASFTSTDNKGIPTIAEVLRSGFYLGYYSDTDFPGIWDDNMTKLCLPGLRNIINNPECKYGTAEQDSVIDSFGSLIGNTTCDPQLATQAARLLKDYRVNATQYFKDTAKSGAVFKVMSGIGYVFYIEGYKYRKQDLKTMPSYGKIDKFIEELIEISKIKDLGPDEQWLVNNGLHYLGQLSNFYSKSNEILQIVTEKMDGVQKYSEDFFAAAKYIEENYDGINSRGENINYGKLQDEGIEFWMPKHYTFDNGTIRIHTGDKVSPEKVQRMYWATKEVESQFFRVNGNDKALEPNNPDKILTIRIYNSPGEYKMNSYLNGMNVNNGGMYIEPTGTFYTFERTPKDSVYSLEELFRHEFTHYLQSKYQIYGMWGQGDFYKNNDIEWFDEGTAEFFAGSTRTDGVQPRKAIVNNLASKSSGRFTLDTLFKSGYASGWEFYNYGWAYIAYIYNNDIGKLMEINDSIMGSNINMFKNILNNQAKDSSTEAAYQAYMDKVKEDKTLITPLVGDAYIQEHKVKNFTEVKNDIIAISGIDSLREKFIPSPNFNTFKLEGVYTGVNSKGKIEDWKEMNEKANDMLKNLSTKGWSGYDTVTCYFTDYKAQDGAYQYNIVFRGLLNDNSIVIEPDNIEPLAVISGKSSGKVNELINFVGDKSSDTDGTIKSYLWNFGDGSTSDLANPTHVFEKAGNFTVTLKVIDDKNAMGEESFVVIISENEVVKQDPEEEIKEDDKPEPRPEVKPIINPKTGDNSSLVSMLAILISSLAIMFLINKKRNIIKK